MALPRRQKERWRTPANTDGTAFSAGYATHMEDIAHNMARILLTAAEAAHAGSIVRHDLKATLTWR